MEIYRAFHVSAAHFLPNAPAGHKCRALHGHSFRIEIHLRAPADAATGWVMDFAELKKVVEPVLAPLDHACLNQVEGLANPTSENLARHLWRRLRPALPRLARIVVQESPDCGCVYAGEEDGA